MRMVAQKKHLQTSSESTKKERRVKPELPGGFRDYGPAEAIVRAEMLETICKTFENFGFDPLETSSVQRTEVLTGGEEDSGKIILNVVSSREENYESSDESDEYSPDTSLRFDLTVPLARFVAANPEISKPFKRYQIGNVWRGERPQAGRYREFMQADVDIIGSSSINADAEIAGVIFSVLRALGIDDFIIKYNNRKILNKLPGFAGFPEKKLWNALRIIDKWDKIRIDGVEKELEKEFGEEISKKITAFVFDGMGRDVDGLNEAMDGSDQIRNYLESLGCDCKKYFEFNLWLVRGLSYYTGSVFEVTLPGAPEVGSVCGGGRYDDLVSQFTGQKIPAVGVSIGVDRLFAALEKLNVLKKKETVAQVLVLNLSSGLISDYMEITKQLRDVDINTSFYLGDDTSFQAQLAYGVKKEIPYAVMYGEEEKKKGVVAVKNLATREQKEIKKEELLGFFGK